MSDLTIAGMLLAFLIGLAIAAPTWGYDSRDGIESDRSLRRVAWLYHRPDAQTGHAVGRVLAEAIRAVADRLDEDAPQPAGLAAVTGRADMCPLDRRALARPSRDSSDGYPG